MEYVLQSTYLVSYEDVEGHMKRPSSWSCAVRVGVFCIGVVELCCPSGSVLYWYREGWAPSTQRLHDYE